MIQWWLRYRLRLSPVHMRLIPFTVTGDGTVIPYDRQRAKGKVRLVQGSQIGQSTSVTMSWLGHRLTSLMMDKGGARFTDVRQRYEYPHWLGHELLRQAGPGTNLVEEHAGARAGWLGYKCR
ncbi:hypothetical protein P691DRAFT_785901 [Macrolepiota fuliginosa MF-IS2]|uniref:Uncharacterized protein n=1 Tax=Macrolepiota fuliginosa MF-IS2 TaxID=1400762 RepID=A0A9P5WWN2_9AGAR|nr:hypothetical protein P691DRAFT_785901 [Macrolepiota fuliginosa MF-IS2]